MRGPCSACEFWHPIPAVERVGTCQAVPPTMVDPTKEWNLANARWPRTRFEDTCGVFSPKPAPPAPLPPPKVKERPR